MQASVRRDDALEKMATAGNLSLDSAISVHACGCYPGVEISENRRSGPRGSVTHPANKKWKGVCYSRQSKKGAVTESSGGKLTPTHSGN